MSRTAASAESTVVQRGEEADRRVIILATRAIRSRIHAVDRTTSGRWVVGSAPVSRATLALPTSAARIASRSRSAWCSRARDPCVYQWLIIQALGPRRSHSTGRPREHW